MTDLEICKRIAEIEGLSVEEFENYERVVNGAGICTGFRSFNPLEDKALCFDLMVNHKIEIDFTEGGKTRAWQHYHIDGQDTLSKSTPRAICLAIIEANKEQ